MKLRYCLLLAVLSPSSAYAQNLTKEREVEQFSDQDISVIETPDLTFEETEKEIKNYEKYFYFHRTDTHFNEAFSDITECDALASGIKYFARTQTYDYSPAGIIGGAIGNMMADAIFGSAERRKIRRINVRRCMAFKGYDRYGMEKEIWQEFHFEEGLSSVQGDKRRNYLLQQAKVASGDKPAQEVLMP